MRETLPHRPDADRPPIVPRRPMAERRARAALAAPRSSDRALFRFLAINGALGVLTGELALAMVLGFDVMGVRTLVFNAADPFLPLALLAALFGLTFASAVTATAVLALPYPDPNERPDGRRSDR